MNLKSIKSLFEEVLALFAPLLALALALFFCFQLLGAKVEFTSNQKSEKTTIVSESGSGSRGGHGGSGAGSSHALRPNGHGRGGSGAGSPGFMPPQGGAGAGSPKAQS